MFVRTVLGDVDGAALGRCDAHDHLFFASAKLPGAELDDLDAAVAEATAFAAAGGATVVHWTPAGLGRRAGWLVEVARRTGLHVVAATGRHRAEHYGAGWPVALDVDALTDLFVRELTEGLLDGDDPDAPLLAARAGLIKVGTGYHALDGHERTALRAAAEAHRGTGAPIGVHLELGTHGAVVLDRLTGWGVPPDRVILGHLVRNPDLRHHVELAEAGAFLAFDGPSLANHRTDWRLPDLLGGLAERGYGDRLLLGGDTTTRGARAVTGGGPGMPALLSTTAAALTRYFGADLVERMLVHNPARAFAFA